MATIPPNSARLDPPLEKTHSSAEKIHLNPKHKGLLHEELHVPLDKPIPAKKLSAALHSTNPKEKERAEFARNFGK